MRKNHNIFYLALYVGSAVGMVGSGIADFLYIKCLEVILIS